MVAGRKLKKKEEEEEEAEKVVWKQGESFHS